MAAALSRPQALTLTFENDRHSRECSGRPRRLPATQFTLEDRALESVSQFIRSVATFYVFSDLNL